MIRKYYDSEERWIISEKYPNYKISTHGRAITLMTGEQVKICYSKNEPPIITLRDEYNIAHTLEISRMILEVFDGDMGPDYVPHYKDGNRYNIHLDNLEWQKYRPKQKLISDSEIFRNSTIEEVETGKIYYSVYTYTIATGEPERRTKECLKNPNILTRNGCHLRFYEYIEPGPRGGFE